MLPNGIDDMPIAETISNWLHMAGTLFWKKNPPPLIGGVIPEERQQKLTEATDALVEKATELERELRRYGIISRR